MTATKVGEEGDYVVTVDAVRIDHQDDDTFSTPSANPAVAPIAAPTASAPSIQHSDPAPVPATHSTSSVTMNENTDLSNVQRAIYFKNPMKATIEQSKHTHKTSAGVIFVGTATNTFQGKFTAAKNINAGHIMSGDTIDLSLADFVYPVTRVKAVAIMGHVKVIVPRGVRVQTAGVGILGEFRNTVTTHGRDAPLVVIEGCAIMGAVNVRVNQEVPPVLVV
eukprot:CAMPEP_0181102048 /NCGR_PEP_ID=MMETSP1071-20121207/14097_1 /TAXON_ID=35127 /ORGANISM="Thalassiosira sp., Strain NH16" /LENGTH=220 /DNA_ID=CAMNT_0023184975 /DNA_START=115 /DNA_END=777 /DNA_ORIENTATION=+